MDIYAHTVYIAIRMKLILTSLAIVATMGLTFAADTCCPKKAKAKPTCVCSKGEPCKGDCKCEGKCGCADCKCKK